MNYDAEELREMFAQLPRVLEEYDDLYNSEESNGVYIYRRRVSAQWMTLNGRIRPIKDVQLPEPQDDVE